MIEIKLYVEEMFQFTTIFAFTKEQVKEAESYYKEKFKINFSDHISTENVRGFTATMNGNGKQINVKNFSILFINFDTFKGKINTLDNVSNEISIMSTINHELYHLVETIISKYIHPAHKSKVQEPGARLMSWLTVKFYEEYNRQGYGFNFVKLN